MDNHYPKPEIPQKSGKLGYKSPPVATQFKPGNLANPGGKPVKSKNRLQGDFMRALADDFEQHGTDAIVAMRKEKPADYIRVVAGLMPKALEVTTTTTLDSMSLEELEESLAILKRMQAGDVTDVVDVATKVLTDAST